MNSTSAIDCPSSEIGWVFLVLNISVFTIAFLSLIGNAFICFILTKSHSLPSNVTLLLRNSAFAAAFGSAMAAVRGAFGVYVWISGFAPVTRFQCAMMECPSNTFVLGFTLSISIVGIERLISVRKTRNVDSDKPSTLAYVMMTTAWSFSALVNCAVVVFGYFDPDSRLKLCYCNGLLVSPKRFATVFAPIYVAIELFTVVCYALVYKYSRSSYLSFTINTTQHSLAHRYQMISNIRTTILLMPTIIIHGLIYVILTAIIAYFTIALEERVDLMFAINYTLALFVIGCTEGFSHPLWLLGRHEHILKAAARYLPFLKRFLHEKSTGSVENGPRSRPGAIGVQKKPRALPGSNRIANGVVDFRMKPDQNDDILNAIWASKPGLAR